MGTTAHEIASHIERTRGELGSNIDELERKVKSVADWEYQFQARPMALIGLAFGSGVILASILAGGKTGGTRKRNFSDRPQGCEQGRAAEAWDAVKGAIFGIAASRFTDVVEGFVPGFKEHFQGSQRSAAKSSSRPRTGAPVVSDDI